MRSIAQLKVFVDLSSISDLKYRCQSLYGLEEQLYGYPFLCSVVMATADVLCDEQFIRLSEKIVCLIGSILGNINSDDVMKLLLYLGTSYDAHINLCVNSLLYDQVYQKDNSIEHFLEW